MRGEKNDGTFIRTFTGRFFWPCDPRQGEIFIEDIAHALSNQCRWSGHVKSFYSVAQHLVIASQNVAPEFALSALLHDAQEAYLVDMPRPIKKNEQSRLGKEYKKLETVLEKLICKKFALPWPHPDAVKEIDETLGWTEKRDLMVGDWNEVLIGKPRYLPFKLEGWRPQLAERRFLARFHKLIAKREQESITLPFDEFTTRDYCKKFKLERSAAQTRLIKLEKSGVIERAMVSQLQGGIRRQKVMGWRLAGLNKGKDAERTKL